MTISDAEIAAAAKMCCGFNGTDRPLCSPICDECLRDAERALTAAYAVRDETEKLLPKQEPLCEPFATILRDNLDDMLVEDGPIAVRDEWRPEIDVNEEACITSLIFEDVAHVAKPLHKGFYHFIDELRAMDDNRLVGIQYWVGKPRPLPSPPKD